jgi:predicted nucleotidyltransferase
MYCPCLNILWAGIFGSVSRNRAHKESDVDILIVLKEHVLTGEPIDLRESMHTFPEQLRISF